MKKIYIIIIAVVAVFYAILYFWGQEEKIAKQHPTIHSPAGKPDDYLLEAKEFESEHRHDKSAYSIERAIQSIWDLEKDVDDKSFERLEQSIEKLEAVHRKIIKDSLSSEDLLTALEYALGNLAHAELEVAEKYSAANQTDEARSALRYAQLHIKNALVLHNPNAPEDSAQMAKEAVLLDQMDSLLRQKDLSHPEYLPSLDKMIKEVDQIINKVEN